MTRQSFFEGLQISEKKLEEKINALMKDESFLRTINVNSCPALTEEIYETKNEKIIKHISDVGINYLKFYKAAMCCKHGNRCILKEELYMCYFHYSRWIFKQQNFGEYRDLEYCPYCGTYLR